MRDYSTLDLDINSSKETYVLFIIVQNSNKTYVSLLEFISKSNVE
jgi:hypothetical protein